MNKRISLSLTRSLDLLIIRYQVKQSFSHPQEIIRDAPLLLKREELADAYIRLAGSNTLKDNTSSPTSESCNARSVHVDHPQICRGEVYRLKAGTPQATGLVLVVSEDAMNHSNFPSLTVLEVKAGLGNELSGLETTFELASQRLKVQTWGLSQIAKNLLEPLPLGTLSKDELSRVGKLLALHLGLD